MAPQKEENKKRKCKPKGPSKLARKRLMRERRALQNVPRVNAHINAEENLNVNVDAGDEVFDFIEPVINVLSDSGNSDKNENPREADSRSISCRSNVRYVGSAQNVIIDVANADPALPGPDNILSVTPITTATSVITTTTTTTTNINTRSSARVAARTVVTSEARDLLSDVIYFYFQCHTPWSSFHMYTIPEGKWLGWVGSRFVVVNLPPDG